MKFPGHLKRFKESTISGKLSLKVVAIFILLRISFFSIRIILASSLLYLLDKIWFPGFPRRCSSFAYIHFIKVIVFWFLVKSYHIVPLLSAGFNVDITFCFSSHNSFSQSFFQMGLMILPNEFFLFGSVLI